MFDLTRLRLLRELAHRGTMTAVGAALGQTSSAVSQQLAILEREARAKLLERVGRRVRLTAEGERLAAHADAILQAVLEVCCFPTFAKARLLTAITRARAHYPELRVIIHELESADAIAAVRDGRCHLAISFTYSLAPQPDVPGLVSHPLIEEAVVLALPKRWRRERQPIALKRLAREDWIIGSRQTDDRQLAERACALAGFAPRMTHTIDDYDLMLRMVAAGLGVGFVPELALSFSDTKAVALRTPGGVPPLRRRIFALTRSALATSPMVRALLAELR